MRRGKGCRWVSKRLAAYAACDPELTAAECRAIENHIRCCERCRTALTKYDESLDNWGALLHPAECSRPIDATAMVRRILAPEVRQYTQRTPA